MANTLGCMAKGLIRLNLECIVLRLEREVDGASSGARNSLRIVELFTNCFAAVLLFREISELKGIW